MSCNGCRVLRKGCSETCVLRPCLQWIESPEAQGHATLFVAKFFGRAGLMSFISAVHESQRPALFQSLLFESAGRTVNPVNGAVGLLWTGNWHVCQAAVDTVLRGGTLKPIPELRGGATSPDMEDASEITNSMMLKIEDPSKERRSFMGDDHRRSRAKNITQLADLDLSLTPIGKKSPNITSPNLAEKRRRGGSPSMNSEESETTTCGDHCHQPEIKLLSLFN